MSGLLRTLGDLVFSVPNEVLEFIVAFALNLLFLGLLLLALWPAGMTPLAVSLAKGYAVLWGATSFAANALSVVQRVFRVDMYSHFDAFLGSNLAVAVLLLAGWSAFAALTAGGFAADAVGWGAAGVYFAGLLASFVGYAVVTSFYQGTLYRFVGLGVALAGFLLFSVWPVAARALFGWFFDLF